MIQSLNQLNDLYREKYKEAPVKPLSYFTFNKLFHDVNLSIHPLKKHKCDLCVQHEIRALSDEQWTIHTADKNQARVEKDVDKMKTRRYEYQVLTMDLQAVKKIRSESICASEYDILQNKTMLP